MLLEIEMCPHTYVIIRPDRAKEFRTIRVLLGPVQTETFSCVFVLFTVLKGIENNQLITWNNTKTQENVSVCTGPQANFEEP